MRAHCQNAGVSLTAQQPQQHRPHRHPGTRRGLRRDQSLHTNSFDEAFAIPSEEAIKIAVRTQQILLHETGAGDVVDPLAGSYYVESLTSRIEEESHDLIRRIDELGGMIEAITSGFVNQVIADSAWEQQIAVEQGDRLAIGVNEFVDDDRSTAGIEMFKVDPGVHERQLERLDRALLRRQTRGRDAEGARAGRARYPPERHAGDPRRRTCARHGWRDLGCAPRGVGPVSAIDGVLGV